MATQLTQVRERLQSGRPLAAADRVALLTVLNLVQQLQPSPSSRRERRVTRRDELIRRLARIHFPGLCRAAQAERISDLARSYHAGGWVHDRQQAGPPERLQDKPERFLWLAFKTDVRFPFSPRQIDRILK